MCYPYALLEEALSNSLLKMSNQMRKDDLEPEQRKRYQGKVKEISVPLQAELGRTKISIRDLIQMQQGDVIPLEQRVEEPLSIKVNDHKKMMGFPGKVRKNKAIKIYDFIDKNNKEDE
jgi:flagellar motor switch protein FliM